MLLYLIAYAPSSPQRLQDLAKLAFSMSIVSAFVVVKPVGMAAQIGVPEVFKLAYKLNKIFLVFPKLQDLKEILSIEDIVFVMNNVDNALDLCEIELSSNSVGIVVQAGETIFTKEELAIGKIVKITEIDSYRIPNAVADAAIVLSKLYKRFKNKSC